MKIKDFWKNAPDGIVKEHKKVKRIVDIDCIQGKQPQLAAASKDEVSLGLLKSKNFYQILMNE